MGNLIRKHILNINPYIAGKPIEETKRELGLKNVIKLASNENPLGPSPKAVAAIKKNLSKINRYPDSSGFYLKNKLAKNLFVEPDNIVLGNGSDEIISIIIKTFVEDDESIITADTTFLEYAIISRVENREIIEVPLRDFKYDLEGIKKKINNKTKLIFIANPNNPTGTYINKRELSGFIADLPENVLLVLDEAYDTFIDVDDFPRGLELRGREGFSKIIVMKTFSKAYGLAGLRIGYAIAVPELVSAMERVRQPFNVNLPAQAAAEACLDDKEFLNRTQKTVFEGKEYLYRELKKLKITYVPSTANFILLDVEMAGEVFFKQMLGNGVIVRDMRQYGLNNFIRVTIGTRKENERFIRVLKKVIKNG